MLKKIIQLFKKRQNLLPLDRSDWVVLATGLTVFSTITFWTITKSSVWFDEAFGAYLIQFDFGSIAKYTAVDVHPPVYYWVLKLWSMLFGTSELGLRSMSVLFGGVAIFFAFLLTKRMFGRRAAWASLAFMAITPMLMRYGQEMRMYTMVAAIAFAATYVLTIAVEQKKRKYWVIYGLLVALGMWTHYFSALIWLSHWAWRAGVVRSETKINFWKTFFSKDWIIAHVIAVGVFLPWVPSLVKQLLTVQINGFWIPPVSPSTLPNFFTNLLYYQDQDTVSPWGTLVVITIIAVVITLAVRVYRTLNAVERQNYLLLCAVAFVPVALLILASMPPLRSSFIDRYLLSSILGMSLFLGVTLALGLRVARKKCLLLTGIVVVGAMIFGLYNVTQLGNYNKSSHTANITRQAVEAITAKAHDGEPIIAQTPWIFYEAVFYSTANHPVYFIDATTQYLYGSLAMLKDNDQHKIKNLDAFGSQHPTIWYLGRLENDQLGSPNPTWKKLQHLRLDDYISHRPTYEAVQYQTQ